MKILKLALLAIGAVFILGAAGFLAYSQIATAEPEPLALDALTSDDEVEVEVGDWLVFKPRAGQPATGLVFYPGALVDPRAYAPFARDIASEGYLVVIPSMPLNLAVFGQGEAQKVIEANPAVENWAVGGHSLGGVMASQFIKDYPWAADGLTLWGAYPSEGSDISCRVLEAVSIYGTRDGLTEPTDIEAARHLLPPDTDFVAIEGGNHAQFGWYGPQSRDLPADIDHLDQQAQTVAATLQMLARLSQ